MDMTEEETFFKSQLRTGGRYGNVWKIPIGRSTEFRKVIWVQVGEDGGLIEHQCMLVEIGLSANSTTVLNRFCSFFFHMESFLVGI